MALESYLPPKNSPQVVIEEGLLALVFRYENIVFNVSAKAIRDPRAMLPVYRVPYMITFPFGATLESNLVYDAHKGVFIHKLVEDEWMQEYFPEEFEKSCTDQHAWNQKWDLYRLEVSGVFLVLFNASRIPMQTIRINDE